MKLRKDSSSEKLLDNFFVKSRESQSKAIAMLLFNATLSELFVKYNTFQCSSGTLVFIIAKCAEAKTICTQQSMVDIDCKVQVRQI